MQPLATMAPKATTPSGFAGYLAKRWNEGCTMGKQLLAEVRPLGYTGNLTHPAAAAEQLAESAFRRGDRGSGA